MLLVDDLCCGFRSALTSAHGLGVRNGVETGAGMLVVLVLVLPDKSPREASAQLLPTATAVHDSPHATFCPDSAMSNVPGASM